MKWLRKIEIMPRACAAILLSAHILSLESVSGKILLILSMCILLVFLGILIMYIIKTGWREMVEQIVNEDSDPVFWPAILLLWMSTEYVKGIQTSTLIVMLCLFCLSIASPVANYFLDKRNRR